MFGGNVIFMGEFKTCKFMFKKIVIFFLVFICIIILSGCKKADSNVTYNYGSSDSLTVYKELDKEFYMFRAGNKYYEFRRIDGYLTIEDMYDTENSDIPDMNDGDLMKVTADVDIYYGGISGSNHSIKINKLKSADLMDYNQIIDLLEIDDIADDISINRMNIIKMHRNEKNFEYISRVKNQEQECFMKNMNLTMKKMRVIFTCFWKTFEVNRQISA